jgi:hypothetical protein
MVECIAAWLCLGFGIFSGNPLWYITSGVFAVAVQISRMADGKYGK